MLLFDYIAVSPVFQLVFEFTRFNFKPLVFFRETFQLKVRSVQLWVNLTTLGHTMEVAFVFTKTSENRRHRPFPASLHQGRSGLRHDFEVFPPWADCQSYYLQFTTRCNILNVYLKSTLWHTALYSSFRCASIFCSLHAPDFLPSFYGEMSTLRASWRAFCWLKLICPHKTEKWYVHVCRVHASIPEGENSWEIKRFLKEYLSHPKTANTNALFKKAKMSVQLSQLEIGISFNFDVGRREIDIAWYNIMARSCLFHTISTCLGVDTKLVSYVCLLWALITRHIQARG